MDISVMYERYIIYSSNKYVYTRTLQINNSATVTKLVSYHPLSSA